MMKKVSKVLSLVLAICMLLTCVTVPAFAAKKEEKVVAEEVVAEVKVKTIDDYPDEAYLMDANDKNSIEDISKNLKAVTTNTNENAYSAEWSLKSIKQLQLSAIKDINGFETVEFYLYGDEKHPTTLKFTVWANDPDTDGSDYYDAGNFEVKPGWNKYSFSLSEMLNKKTRQPKSMDSIDNISIWATGWDLDAKNDLENTVLYLDSVKLIKGEKLLTVPKVKVPETEAGTAKYLEYDFEAEGTDATKGIILAPKSNKIEVRKNKNNHFLSIMGQETTDNCFADITGIKYTRRYMVIQGDFMIENLGGSVQLATIKDGTNAQTYFAGVNKDGKITGNGKFFGTAEEGKWFNLAVCADFDSLVYTVYIDGKEVMKDVPFNNQNSSYMTYYRAFVGPNCKTILNIDNLRVYDGKTPADYVKAVDTPKPRKIDLDSVISKTPAYKQVMANAVSEVKDAVCLKVNSPYALVRHEQKAIDVNNKEVSPFIINGRTLVPVRFIAEAFGAEVGWDDATRTVTVKKDSELLTLVIGSNVLNKNGQEIIIDVPAEIYNERTMLPLRAVTENLGKKVFWDDMGLIIISNNEINFTKENDLEKMLDIMAGFTYERPGAEKLLADIVAKTPNHPRLLATAEDFARIRNLMSYDENIQSWVSRLMKTADKYVTAAPDEAEHTYAADAGGRLANSWNIQSKATSMGMAYQLTGDKKYIDAIWYTLEDLCDKSKWEHWHPGHFLNAADVIWGVAIAYDWMYDGWSDSQRAIIEEALFDCGVEDSITAYHGASDYLSPPMGQFHRSGWWSQGNNWNAVCNSGVMAAGIAMATHEKYGKYAIQCVDYALNAMEIGLRCYAPDGGYEEGVGYWSYGTNHAIMLMEALNKATGTNYGLSDAPGFSVTYVTPLYMESKQGSFNYSDTTVSRTDTASLFWFGKEYCNAQVNGIRFNEISTAEKASSYKDILWYNPENIDKNASLVLDYKFFGTDTFTMRSSWTDANQLFGGIHGGSNTTNHCNIDSGVFILDSLNTRWFIDLGSDNYNLPNYWSTGAGGKRWKYYTQRAEGHNCFVINPNEKEDQVIDSVCHITELVSKPRGAYGKVDLTPAYATDVTKATRGMMFTANRKAAIVQDEITMKAPSEFWWFAHTKAEIEVAADGRSAILTQGSKKLHAAIVSDNPNFKFTVMDAVSLPTSPVPEKSDTQKEKSREDIRKLAIHDSGVSNVNLAVVFQPLVGDMAEYTYTYTNLDNWSIPDGEILTPQLTELKVEGQTIEGFNAKVTSYEVVLPFGTTQVPEIVATADALSNAVLTPPTAIPGTATIKVMNNEDASMYSVYNVLMRAAEEVEIEVSDAQEGNPGQQCIDKDLSTRWAVENEAWGIFRFAIPKTISSVWLATWKAAERKLIFDIEVSEDGENFTQVWSGQTTIDKDELEEIKIPAGTYKAVKIKLHGTTTGTWNSILEVEFK